MGHKKEDDIKFAIDSHLKYNSNNYFKSSGFDETSPKNNMNKFDDISLFKIKTLEHKMFHQQEKSFRVGWSVIEFKSVQPESREGATFVGNGPNF